ncbi:MAG: S24 family peptidase [Bifidobacteriaceae bacterium]|jgi:DNA polymerase V|nr:S24 family peptidase [Bifidobacteriaceae bacterium]MCI1914544.1 S24 family peptidase [Bifidobacteriaceae bacterium]
MEQRQQQRALPAFHSQRGAHTRQRASSVKSVARVIPRSTPLHIPHALEAVHAGFPSVAQDYFLRDFSFDDNVITNPETTFAVSVAGDSMEGAGIYDGDLLLVDRSLTASDQDIVVAVVDAEMTVKRLCYSSEHTPYLHPENPRYPDIHLDDEAQLVVWGVVIGNYHYQYHHRHL